jgi:GTP cyclohydrolase II
MTSTKPPILPAVHLIADAALPSRYGQFRVLGFRVEGDPHEYGAISKGDLSGQEGVPVRLHSECFTGDVMGSLRCDCRDQLEAALRFVGHAERGLVVYLPQEGRGIGLVNKIRAYALQDAGLDTVDANVRLGFDDDLRTYDAAAAIVACLGIRSVYLLSNNPKKKAGLERHNIPVIGMIPVRTPANEYNRAYLETKKQKSGHLL